MKNCRALLRQIVTAIVFYLGTLVAIANESLPKDHHGRYYFEFAGHKIALTTLEAGNKDVQITLRFTDTQSVWRRERILKEPDLFRQGLNEAILVYAMWTNEFSTNHDELIDVPQNLKGQNDPRNPRELKTFLEIAKPGPRRFKPREDKARIFFEAREISPKEKIDAPSRFEYELEHEGKFHDVPLYTKLTSKNRLFRARKDLYLYQAPWGISAEKMSEDRLIRGSLVFHPRIHRKHWRDIDLFSQNLLKNLFISPLPEGLE